MDLKSLYEKNNPNIRDNNMSWLDSFKEQPSGIGNLGCAILDASYKCGNEFKELINEKFGMHSKEADLAQIQVMYEFLFFFTHLTMRYALAELGDNKRVKLQDFLVPIFADVTTEAWFGHWPEKFKKGIKDDFFNNINTAEIDYSECKDGLLSKDKPFTRNALISKLARNIAQLSGCEDDPVVIMQCIVITIKEFINMKLDELVVSVGKEI